MNRGFTDDIRRDIAGYKTAKTGRLAAVTQGHQFPGVTPSDALQELLGEDDDSDNLLQGDTEGLEQGAGKSFYDSFLHSALFYNKNMNTFSCRRGEHRDVVTR